MIDRSTIRVALRTLARHKGFTTVAIIAIGIAIALNTVMYSVLDAFIAPRINARAPETVYSLRYYGNGIGVRKIPRALVEEAFSQGLGPNVEGVTASQAYLWGLSERPTIEFGDRYYRTAPINVWVNYFDFLGAVPLQGRTFRESDEREQAAVVVISDRVAQHLFPDATAVAQTVTLDGNGYTVIGVVERTSLFQPLDGDVWLLPDPKSIFAMHPNLVRLKEVVPDHQLKDQLTLAAARLAQSFDAKTQWVAFQGKQIYKGQLKVPRLYFALVGSVAAILLVACANLANLQLARGLARNRELALRAAVGASRTQLIRLLLLESGVLAAAGLALGVVLTFWGMKLVDASMPEVVASFILRPQTSWRVFAFAAGAAVTCLILVGLLPALSVSKVDPNEMLKSGAGTGANREHRKRYGLMIVAQFGLALPVLIATIVMLRNAWRINRAEYIYQSYGFDGRQVLVGSAPYTNPVGGAKRVVRTLTAANDILDRARATPGILDAAVSTWTTPEGRRVTVDGADGEIREVPAHQWSYASVTPSYFRTFSRRIARGRDFEDGETDGRVVILDSASAAFLWKNDNPIGRSIKFGPARSGAPWLRVVGVLAETGQERDAANDYMRGRRLAGVYRLIAPQDSFVTSHARHLSSLSFVARVRGNTELASLRLQRNLRSIAGLSAPSAIPITFELTPVIVSQNFFGSMFSVFAAIGLGLVAMGVYGIVAHSVAERRRELAVRISLGASPGHIYRAVLREGNVLLLAGLALGLLVSKFTVRWVSMLSMRGDIYNAPLYGMVGLVLFAVAVAAAYVPALRATRIDPVEALRHE